MLQSPLALSVVSKLDCYSISVNPIMNRLYIYFSDTRENYESLLVFSQKLSEAFGLLRPYCTLVIDNRVGYLPERFRNQIRFDLISLSIQKPVGGFAEVVKAQHFSVLPYHSPVSLYPFQPLFKKFTTVHSAESWLNDIKTK